MAIPGAARSALIIAGRGTYGAEVWSGSTSRPL
jgi:hypothetical protein